MLYDRPDPRCSWIGGDAVHNPRYASMASSSDNTKPPSLQAPYQSTRSRQPELEDDKKKDEAAEMFKKSQGGVANPSGDGGEQVARLATKIEQLEDREGMMFDRVQNQLSAMTESIAALTTQMNMTVASMKASGKDDEEDMKGDAGQEGAKSDRASGASASGWAADHPNEKDGTTGRDGGRKKHPKKEQDSSNESSSESDSDGGKPSGNRGRRNGGDPDSDPSGSESSDDSSDDAVKRRGSRGKRSGSTQGKRKVKNYESRSSVRKIIKDEFRSSIDKIGDPKFELYRKNWKAMSRDYHIREKHLVRFMNRLFDGDVLLVYQNVREEHPFATASEIWRLMSVVCYNSNHQASVRDKVFRPKYDSRSQTIEEYGNAIKTAALALGYGIPERQLIDQFEQGLPTSLEKHVTGLSGTFDEIVAMTAKYERACKRPESFRRMGEGDEGNYLTINGGRVRRRPASGVLCYRHRCDVNGGRDHFARDHKEPAPAAPAQAQSAQAQQGNGSGAASGQTAPSNSQ